MSKTNKIDQLKGLLRTLESQHIEKLLGDEVPIAEWEGLSKGELIEAFDSCKKTIRQLIDTELLGTLPFVQINQLFSSVTAANQHIQALVSQPNQQTFQNFAQQIDNFNYHLNLANADYLLLAGKDLTEIRQTYEEETRKLEAARLEVQTLEDRVGDLIEPAVSGSLSKSFSERKSSLFYSRLFWLAAWVISGGVAIFFTQQFVVELTAVLLEGKSSSNELQLASGNSMMYIALLRSAILVPIYLVFFFALNQYRKERNFEEEYAHKAAVASALPSYGRLAEDAVVKDQIVTQASAVIFRSPVDRKTDSKDRAIDKAMDQVERIIKLSSKENVTPR